MLLTNEIDSAVQRRQALARVYTLLIRLAEASGNKNVRGNDYGETTETKKAQARTELSANTKELGKPLSDNKSGG